MSWLRKQSIESFRALNPTWQVVLIDGSGIPIELQTPFESVLRSDWARYRELAARGGMYFDTDIVFCKPIPDSWLNHDLILPMGEDQVVAHIASIGASPGNAWFRSLDRACGEAYQAGEVYNYQFFGIQLVNRMSVGLRGMDTCWIGPESFMSVAWCRTECLWTEHSYLSPMTYGIHWYGGDKLSASREMLVDVSWAKKSTCMVALALKASLNLSGDLEAHRVQLGV